MILRQFSVHQLDRENNNVRDIAISAELKDLASYVDRLVTQVVDSSKRRVYTFANPASEVPLTLASAYTESAWSSSASKLAIRLLNVESRVAEVIRGIAEIPKGSLIQGAMEVDGEELYLIAKVEHDEFLDQNDLIRRLGLPYARQALKTCLVRVDEGPRFETAWVSDSSTRFAEYWWKNFLELSERRSDTENTRAAFKQIDRLLRRKLKSDHPSDYTFLRNAVGQYFLTQAEFNMDELVNNAIGRYRPSSEEVGIDDLAAELKQMEASDLFDARFTIDEEAVRRPIARTIELTAEIDLRLKAPLEDLQNVVKAKRYPDGRKYLEIETNSGWEAFYRTSGDSTGHLR